MYWGGLSGNGKLTFTMYFQGPSGNGNTTFTMYLLDALETVRNVHHVF